MYVKQNISTRISSLDARLRDTLVLSVLKRWAQEYVVPKAQANAPVRTGFLRDSIDYEIQDDGVLFKVGAHYGIFVEFGTQLQDAQPYLIPAIQEHIQDLINIIKQELRR